MDGILGKIRDVSVGEALANPVDPTGPFKLALVDCTSIFALMRRMANDTHNVSYEELKKVIGQLEREVVNDHTFSEFVAIVTIDRENPGQVHYVNTFIENAGFSIKAVDFRYCYNDLSRGPKDDKLPNKERDITSASTTLAYELGQLHSYEDVELTILTDSAELIPMIMDLVRSADSPIRSIHLIWPSISMDARWSEYWKACSEPNSKLRYSDLSNYLTQILIPKRNVR